MKNRDDTPAPDGCQRRLVLLGSGRGKTHADEIASLGLKVGDTIRGREDYPSGWNEARLRVLWVGESVVVYWKEWRSNHMPERWVTEGETARFSLSCRDWFLEQNT
jgi:hypothetical protein